ncbi:hypothetical protein K4O76_03990 [Staphylococcus epidermidis]|nr:hypothetical protein [Staphylococcus epidermidis]MCG2265590.1 hypothetical protein [Staphylococcus epidermidis]
MFTISIIAMIIGVVLIVLSQIIYHSKPIDAKEKMFIPGVCLFFSRTLKFNRSLC